MKRCFLMNLVSSAQTNSIGLSLSGVCKIRLRFVEATSTIMPQSCRVLGERAQLSVQNTSRMVAAAIPIFVQNDFIKVSMLFRFHGDRFLAFLKPWVQKRQDQQCDQGGRDQSANDDDGKWTRGLRAHRSRQGHR